MITNRCYVGGKVSTKWQKYEVSASILLTNHKKVDTLTSLGHPTNCGSRIF